MTQPTISERDDVSYLHAAAIGRGLGFVLTGNGVLLVGPAADPTVLCLAQGVSPTTSQAAAAFLREPDVLRHMLAERDLPVPPWRTMRFTDDTDAIADAAEQVGYPLALRPIWPVRKPIAPASTVPVADSARLADGIAELRVLMDLPATEPVSRKRRFLLEADPAQTTVQALIAADTVLAVVVTQAGSAPRSLPVACLHPEVRDLLPAAVAVLPGIEVATVQLTLDDHTHELTGQQHSVRQIDIHPQLDVYERAEPGMAETVANALLEHHADRAGLRLTPPREVVTLELRIDGVIAAERHRQRLTDTLQAADSTATVLVEGETAQSLAATVRGTPTALAALTRGLVDGGIDGLKPHYVEARQN